MQARPTAKLPHGREWRYEIKWDGWRVLALKDGGSIRLVTRNETDITRQFPAIAAAVAKIRARSAVLDGELVGLDADGRPSFQVLMRRNGGAAAFFAFDLLHLDGADLRGVGLDERKTDLPRLVAKSGVQAPDELRGEPVAIAREARKLGLEGIVRSGGIRFTRRAIRRRG